jgi:hypothetical protein
LNEKAFKGYAGENYVIGDLTERGFLVLRPELPSTPFDVGVLIDGRFYKVQVKSGTFVEGKMKIDVRKSLSSGGRHYRQDDFDILAIYETSTKQIAYITYSERTQYTFLADNPRTMNGYKKDFPPVVFSDYTEFSLFDVTRGA